jgi:hypothetical protein
MIKLTQAQLEKMEDQSASYSICHGPAEWRQEVQNILENLVHGQESEADLDRIDNYLLSLYINKNPNSHTMNRTEYEKMDFHQRMAKEIRRRQYDLSIRSRSRSKSRGSPKGKSPKRHSPTKVFIEPPSQFTTFPADPTKHDLLSTIGAMFSKTFHKPQTAVNPNDSEVKVVPLSTEILRPPPTSPNPSPPPRPPLTPSSPEPRAPQDTGIPVNLPKSSTTLQPEYYEVHLTSTWERVTYPILNKIKNFVTSDGLHRYAMEDNTDLFGRAYLLPLPGNIKMKHHQNKLLSSFLLLEKLTTENGEIIYRSIDGWLCWSDHWNCCVEYSIDEEGNVKIRELKGTLLIEYENYPKADG